MRNINLNPPSGTRDFLPEELVRRNNIFKIIKNIYESFGFQPLETPAFERLEVLAGKYGEEGEKLIYKILKRGDQAEAGESDLALRYDLTIPLARIVAKYGRGLPSIFKRYQIGPVWRADRPGKGRFREFYQCDVDIAGNTTILADAEIIFVLSSALKALGIQKFTIKLNSRKVLAGLMEYYGIKDVLRGKVLTVLDKMDKIGLGGVEEEIKKTGLSDDAINMLITEIGNPESEKTIKERLAGSSSGSEGLKEVDEIMAMLKPILEEESKIIFSPFLARGLDYYTGPIFEILAEGASSSIASGGRYDNLVEIFSNKKVPVCGGSLGVERIILALEKKEGEMSNLPCSDALVSVWDESFRVDALKLMADLIRSGVKTEIYLGSGNISKQLRFASDKGISYLIICGPDEKEKNIATLKNLKTGEQENIPVKDLADRVRKKLA